VRLSDTVVGAGFAAAGALIVTATLGYPTLDGGHPGPALFPRLVGGLMALGGGALAVRGVRARDAGEQVEWRALHRTAGFVNAACVLAAVTAYVLLADRVGFLLMGAAVVTVLMWRLGVRLWKAALVGVLFTVAVHFLFAKVLRVPLPPGLLWW
jgi:putative tricarboxylic transport membrane protein